MVIVKTAAEIKKLREAGRLSALALKVGGEAVVPGVTTAEIDRVIHDFIVKNGATPSFLNLYGFPASACISVNDELIHGIPGNRVIQEGDIVTIDVGACLDGYHGDNAATFAAGTPSEEARRLMDVTREYVGHGVGRQVHEDPEVPNYGKPGHGVRLVNGMVIAIEPMINAGTRFVVQDNPNGWTVRTKDGKLCAHFENTIAITPNGPLILTDPN